MTLERLRLLEHKEPTLNRGAFSFNLTELPRQKTTGRYQWISILTSQPEIDSMLLPVLSPPRRLEVSHAKHI
jgi:hypothetical protein